VARTSFKLAALLVSTALLTSACAIGFDAATNQQNASGNGRSANVGTIEVRDATVVIDPTKPGHATFVGTLINKSSVPDKFFGLSLDPAVGTSAPLEVVLNKQEPAQFGFNSQLTLALTVSREVKAGSFITVFLGFANNKAITMNLLVEYNDGIYSGVTVN
jgi:copper(I)-binding protein